MHRALSPRKKFLPANKKAQKRVLNSFRSRITRERGEPCDVIRRPLGFRAQAPAPELRQIQISKLRVIFRPLGFFIRNFRTFLRINMGSWDTLTYNKSQTKNTHHDSFF